MFMGKPLFVRACCVCGKVAIDDVWVTTSNLKEYVGDRKVSHTYCPSCEKKARKEMFPPKEEA